MFIGRHRRCVCVYIYTYIYIYIIYIYTHMFALPFLGHGQYLPIYTGACPQKPFLVEPEVPSPTS